LLEILREHQALDGSREAVQQYLQAARQTLGVLPETESRLGLFGLTEYLAQQADALGASV
jgi:geranylgeranyl pyrophosphate synthase